MKATRNHFSRMATGYLTAPALVVAILVGAHTAIADTVLPQNTTFTALSSNVSFKLGATTVTCTGSSTNGITPNGSTSPGVPVCVAMSPLIFTGCRFTSFGVSFGATVTADSGDGVSDNWCPTPPLLHWRPKRIRITGSVLGQTCTATFGSAELAGSWSNSRSSVTFTNQSGVVTTFGGFPCPSALSGTFSGTFTTNPLLTVTDP